MVECAPSWHWLCPVGADAVSTWLPWDHTGTRGSRRKAEPSCQDILANLKRPRGFIPEEHAVPGLGVLSQHLQS